MAIKETGLTYAHAALMGNAHPATAYKSKLLPEAWLWRWLRQRIESREDAEEVLDGYLAVARTLAAPGKTGKRGRPRRLIAASCMRLNGLPVKGPLVSKAMSAYTSLKAPHGDLAIGLAMWLEAMVRSRVSSQKRPRNSEKPREDTTSAD